MNIEASDIDSPSSKKSQTSNPPSTMSNQVVAEDRNLEAPSNSSSSMEKKCQRHVLYFNRKPPLSGYDAINQKREYRKPIDGRNEPSR